MTDFQNKIQHYMDAGFPILYLNTYEEAKAEDSVRRASSGGPILVWDGTDRICDISSEPAAVKYETSAFALAEVLDDRLAYRKKQVLLLKNIDTFMDDPAVLARLKKIAEQTHAGRLDTTIVILSPVLRLPSEIEKYITVIEMDYLTPKEIQAVIQSFIRDQETAITKELETSLTNAFILLRTLTGVSRYEGRDQHIRTCSADLAHFRIIWRAGQRAVAQEAGGGIRLAVIERLVALRYLRDIVEEA